MTRAYTVFSRPGAWRRAGRRAVAAGVGLLLAACQTGWSEAPANEDAAVVEALRAGAENSMRLGDYPEAAQQYGKLYARQPDDPQVLVPYLKVLRRIGALRDSLRLVDEHAEDFDDHMGFLLAAARVQIAGSRGEAALETLHKAQELEPKNWEIYSLQGVAHDSLQQYDRAEAAYRAALDLAPGEPVVINNFALSKAQAGDLEGGIRYLRGLLDRSPRAAPQIRQNLALLYGFQGNLEDFEALARLDLSDEMVARNLAVFRKMHRVDKDKETR